MGVPRSTICKLAMVKFCMYIKGREIIEKNSYIGCLSLYYLYILKKKGHIPGYAHRIYLVIDNHNPVPRWVHGQILKIIPLKRQATLKFCMNG